MDDSFESIVHPMDAIIAEMLDDYGRHYRYFTHAEQRLSERHFVAFVTVTRRIYDYLHMQYKWEAPKYYGRSKDAFQFQWEHQSRVIILRILASQVEMYLRDLNENILSCYQLAKPSDIEYAWAYLHNESQLPFVPASLTARDLRSAPCL